LRSNGIRTIICPVGRWQTVLALPVVSSGLWCGASAQTLTVNPQQLSFNAPPGLPASAPQMVTVTPDAAATNGPISFAVNLTAAPWLRVNNTTSNVIPSVPAAGVNLLVTVNTQGLVAGQTYNGYFTVQIPSIPASQVNVNVNLFVGGSSALFAAPANLSFSAIQGAPAGTPASQDVTVSSTIGALGFTLSYVTQSGGDWLRVSSMGGVTGAPSGTFSVTVIPAGLAPGTYRGTITAQSTTTGDQAQVAVTLTVSAAAALTVSPTNPPPFLFRTGGPLPPPQAISVTSNGPSVSFSVTPNPPVGWLAISPVSAISAASIPAAITLTANPSGLPPGAYTTALIVTPAGSAPLPPIPVTLVVSNNPILEISRTSLVFTGPFGGPAPVDQVVNLTASGASVGFTVASDAPWLLALPSANATPAQVTIQANTGGLPVGSYSGTVSIRPTNGDNYALPIRVLLTITNPLQVTASPATLLFSNQIGQPPPPPQPLEVRSTGPAVVFLVGVSTTSCGANWLSVTGNRNLTPATLNVSVATAGFPPGVCTGTVTVTYAGGPAPLLIPVTVAISASALLSVNPPAGFGNDNVQQTPVGSGVLVYSIPLTSTDPAVPVTFTALATTNTAAGWLTAGPGAGTTPQNLVVSILPGGLPPGTFGGQILISSPSFPGGILSQTYALPVTLTVNPAAAVSVTPSSLIFTQPQGGPAPLNQSLTLTSTGSGAGYTASITPITGGDWLDVNPKSGAASRDLTVSIKPHSLAASSTPYVAHIVLTFLNSSTPPAVVPVLLTVTSTESVSLAPQSLSFTHAIGAGAPPPQRLSVTSAGTPVQFSVGVTSASGWLSVDALSGTTPRDLNVSVNPQGLAAGVYGGSISVTGAGLSAAIVNVTLTVTAAAVPQPMTVTNTASNLPGAIAPGELITIKGAGLGPASPPNNGLFRVNAQGGVDPVLFGVRVLFDGIPGTPIYVSAVQINVIVPWEIAGRATVNVVVEYNGVSSAFIQVRVDRVAPAIYTLDTTGSGQAAAVNQDGGLNGRAAPAPPGSTLTVYANGGGQTNPASATGSVSPLDRLLRLAGAVSATIGGRNAIVDFAGAAPGLVTGVVQLNLAVPADVSGDNLAVSITVNGVTSPAGPTVAVR
jgi:uncharacterized protein (TIGR03437 family)